MKFATIAVLALFLATTEATRINKKGDNGKGLAYDLDVPTLVKDQADNDQKTFTYNAAVASQATAAKNQAATQAKAAATSKADADATAAKSKADAAHQLKDYKTDTFDDKESAYAGTVKAKEDALNNKLRAFDDNIEKIHVLNRKNRDLASAKENKDKSDASLKSNQDRVAWEKDQLRRGENQDRLGEINDNSAKKTSEIQSSHDERERGNGRLLKGLASF